MSNQPAAYPDAEPATLAAIADELAAAEQTRVPVAPVTARFEWFDVQAAYAVQSINIERRIARGEPVVGHKVGLTSRAMQQQLGVDEPDFGRLLSIMRLEPGAVLSTGELIQARIEPEIAFVLGRDLAGPGVTVEMVLDATAAVAPALEIIDSRIAAWQIRLADTVADNASSARFVVGEPSPVRDQDLAALEARLYRDGEPVGSGRGSDVLGNPAAAVAWLANKLAEFGESLRAGQVVLPGAMCASVPLGAGVTFRAEIDGLGSVALAVAP